MNNVISLKDAIILKTHLGLQISLFDILDAMYKVSNECNVKFTENNDSSNT
jgi:hypothetical protein